MMRADARGMAALLYSDYRAVACARVACCVCDVMRCDGRTAAKMKIEFMELKGKTVKQEMGTKPYIHVRLPDGRQLLHKARGVARHPSTSRARVDEPHSNLSVVPDYVSDPAARIMESSRTRTRCVRLMD
jgi:hypothetical protein